LVDAFSRGEDVYKIMASAIYNKPPDDVDKSERFIGKTTILGAGYGMGAAKFQAQLKAMGVELPEDECQYIIHTYRNTYGYIPRLWRAAGDALDAMVVGATAPLGQPGVLQIEGKDGVLLPNGLRIKYLDLAYEANPESMGGKELTYTTRKGRAKLKTRIYGGKCVENICQALARIIIGEQMLMVARRYKVAMTVHDAVVAVVPKDEAEEGREFVEQCMRIRPKWASGLPLDCESKIGVSYG
jgi:DNA polymerase